MKYYVRNTHWPVIILLVLAMSVITACGRGSNDNDGPTGIEPDVAVSENASQGNNDVNGEAEESAPTTTAEAPIVPIVPIVPIIPIVPAIPAVIREHHEARYDAAGDAVRGSDVNLVSTHNFGSTGEGYVVFPATGTADNKWVEFTVTVPTDDLYVLRLYAFTNYPSARQMRYIVNDGRISSIYAHTGNSFTSEITVVRLNEGSNTIRISYGTGGRTGQFFLDAISVSSVRNFDRNLSSGSTNPDTLWLWNILIENYGVRVISGHCIHNDVREYFWERDYFNYTIGTMPAILAFEMFDYNYAAVSNGVIGHAVDRAISWAKNDGGIVGFHWHWHMGRQWLAPNQQWWASFYSWEMNDSFWDEFTYAMTYRRGDLYDYIIRDIDLISEQLKRLQAHHVPVLWRPLHEASGEWFWWGGSGPENAIALWRIMHDRMTNYHGLDNLIWIWNSGGADWFPGAAYVDMVSADVGAAANHHLSYDRHYHGFIRDLDYHETMKMLALTETGPIPCIDGMEEDLTMWSFWATWVGAMVGTTRETMRNTLNDPRVITLHDLPPQPNPVTDFPRPMRPFTGLPQQSPPPPPEQFEEWVWWEGSASTTRASWWTLGIGFPVAPRYSLLGPYYRPRHINPGYAINVTFRFNAANVDPTDRLFIEPSGGNTDRRRLYPRAVSYFDENGYRTASFLMYDFVQDIRSTTELFIADELRDPFEITRITLSNRLPEPGEGGTPAVAIPFEDVYLDEILWEGTMSAGPRSWDMQMNNWGGALGSYSPDMFQPGHVINITFKSNEAPMVLIGGEGHEGNINLEVFPLQVYPEYDGTYRVASFCCDEILNAFPDMSNTWAFIVVGRGHGDTEITKITLNPNLP